MNANNKDDSSWNSTEDYCRSVWNRKKDGYDGYGKLSVLVKFPGSSQSIYFCLDHNAATMKDGETSTFEVSAGPHEVCAFDEAWASKHSTVIIKADETTHLVCSEKFSGFQQMWNKLVALFYRPAPDIYLITEETKRTRDR